MIYLTSATTSLVIPRYFPTMGPIELVFTSKVSNSQLIFTVQDTAQNTNYYIFDVSSYTRNFIVGEYDLELRSQGKPVGKYLAQFGEYQNQRQEYNSNDKTNIVYNG